MRQTQIAIDAHVLPFEEFCEKYQVDPTEATNIYEDLHNAKVGNIVVTQVAGNKIGFTYSGHTYAFGINISLFIETTFDYYYTSVIQSIDWENGYFDTINSRYKFKFEDDDMSVFVDVINKSKNPLPEYATPASAGMDLRASLTEAVILKPMERKVIPTDLFMAIPEGYECQIRPRSGLAVKHGITVLNTPGTVDADFRGNIGVILINLSNADFTINPGDRIAQAVFNKFESITFNEVEELSKTVRGEGGFGHSGVK